MRPKRETFLNSMHGDDEDAALTFWMFHARTVPSVEALQTVASLLQRSGC